MKTPQMRKKKKQGFPSLKPQRKHKIDPSGRVDDSSSPKDDGYDGYYDDVLPLDYGKLNEGMNLELVKRMSIVIGVMLLIVILCVVAMYLL